MAEQVAIRLRRAGKKATVVSIHVGYSKQENKKSINTQRRIEPTNQTDTLTRLLDWSRQILTMLFIRLC